MKLINKDTIFRNDDQCLEMFKSQCFLYSEFIFKVKNEDFQKKDITIYQYYKFQPHSFEIVQDTEYIVLKLNQFEYKLILKIWPNDVYSNYTIYVQNQNTFDIYTLYDNYIPLQSNIQHYLSILKENKILTGFYYNVCTYDNETQYQGFLEISQKANTFFLTVNNQNNRIQKEFNLKHLSVNRQNNFQLDSIQLNVTNGTKTSTLKISSADVNSLIIIQLLIQILKCQIPLNKYVNLQLDDQSLVKTDKYLLSFDKETMKITQFNPNLSNDLTLQHMKYQEIRQFVDDLEIVRQLQSQSYVLFNGRYVIFSSQTISQQSEFNIKCKDFDQIQYNVSQDNDKTLLIQSDSVKINISKEGLVKKDQEFMFYQDKLQVKDGQRIVLLQFNNKQDFTTVINGIYYLLYEQINTNQSNAGSSLHALSDPPSQEQQDQSKYDAVQVFKKVNSQLIELSEKSFIDDSVAESEELNVSFIPKNVPKKSRLSIFSKTEGKINKKQPKSKKSKLSIQMTEE